MYKITEIKQELQTCLSGRRWEHTLGVEYTCCALAMCHGEDLETARIAGLLHDCAKHFSGEEMIEFCKAHDLLVNEYEEAFPELLHAKVGAYLAEHKYGIHNNDILSAIKCHTTGKPDMTLLEKIVYIADYIEPNRDRAPNLSIFRKTAFSNLDDCLTDILSATLTYLESNGSIIDPATRSTYEYYKKGGN